MKIVFVLPSLEHAGIRKRVRALQALGITSTVLGFERSYQAARQHAAEYIVLGTLENRRYGLRFWPFIQAIPKIRGAARTADVLYVFGLDLLFLAWLATRALHHPPKLVYEVRDIRTVLTGDGLLSRILRWLERRLAQSVRLIVATSPAYVSAYFQGWQCLNGVEFLVIENKLEPGSLGVPQPAQPVMQDGILRIGYFGLLRCARSWEILKRVAERGQGRVRVYLRGIPMGLPDLPAEAQAIPYITYGGPYEAPEDLPAMYAQVDMVWAGYGYNGSKIGNWCWARTNRFYESCLLQKPMFSQAGTEDGRVVDALELGVSIDLSNVEQAMERILCTSAADIEAWTSQLRRLPPATYLYTDEHQHLLDCLSR